MYDPRRLEARIGKSAIRISGKAEKLTMTFSVLLFDSQLKKITPLHRERTLQETHSGKDSNTFS